MNKTLTNLLLEYVAVILAVRVHQLLLLKAPHVKSLHPVPLRVELLRVDRSRCLTNINANEQINTLSS